MSTLREVIAALYAATDLLPFSQLAEALEAAEEACALVELVATGSGQDEFYQVLDWFGQAKDGIVELQGILTAIHQTVASTIDRLESIGTTPSAESAAPVTQPPPAPAAAPLATAASASPARVRQLLADLPTRTEADPKTYGYWIDEEGHEEGPVASGRKNGYREALAELKALRLVPQHGDPYVASHVEVKFAVGLRHSEAKKITLIINNAPCLQGRYSCDRLLPQILRPDQVVTIHWPDGVKTYHGRRP